MRPIHAKSPPPGVKGYVLHTMHLSLRHPELCTASETRACERPALLVALPPACAMLSRPRAQRQVWTRHVARHASASRSAAPWRRWMVVAESARVGPPRVACHLPRAMPALPTSRREGELPSYRRRSAASSCILHRACAAFRVEGAMRAMLASVLCVGGCGHAARVTLSPSSSTRAAGRHCRPQGAPPIRARSRRPQRSRSYRWSLPTSCSPARRRGRGRR